VNSFVQDTLRQGSLEAGVVLKKFIAALQCPT